MTLTFTGKSVPLSEQGSANVGEQLGTKLAEIWAKTALKIIAVLVIAGAFAVGSPTLGQAQVGAVVARITFAAMQATKLALGSVHNDDSAREMFTQNFVTESSREYPGYNVVISHNVGQVSGTDVVHQHFEIPMTVGTCGYEAYFSPKGRPFVFVRNGDGGFINWAYAGDFARNDATLTAQ
jgi:hypothetical protein